MLAVERTSKTTDSREAWSSRIARNRHERLQAFRLVYGRYVERGLMDTNPFELRVTPYHLLQTTNVFTVHRGENLYGTVTLIGDGPDGVPMEDAYPDLVGRLRRQGCHFGEVSCLAFEDLTPRKFVSAFIDMSRLMAQCARSTSMDRFLMVVHPRHIRFYERFMFFDQVEEARPIPAVGGALGAPCQLDFVRADRERPAFYDNFFGERLPPDTIEPAPMSTEEVEYFEAAAELGRWNAFVPAFA